MISLKKPSQGFTIVELLIVILVIGVLSLLVLKTHSDIQARMRNGKRQTDIESLQRQLEAFFSQNGYYPSLTDLQTDTSATSAAKSSWVSDNMKDLDQTALTDPSNPHQSKNLLSVIDPSKHQYAYRVAQSDNHTSCESDDTTCATYTLTASFEGTVNGKETYEKSNLD